MAVSVTEKLSASPLSIAEARPLLPAEPGLYAWWIKRGELSEVPAAPHPSEPLGLLYVGIAPSRATSTATIRSRVLGQHVGGNTGSSTFRFSLASLLFEDKGWTPLRRGKKVVLSPEDNAALTAWQQANLRIQWCAASNPWEAERVVIEEMQPALNLADNAAGIFYEFMSNARRKFRASAG